MKKRSLLFVVLLIAMLTACEPRKVEVSNEESTESQVVEVATPEPTPKATPIPTQKPEPTPIPTPEPTENPNIVDGIDFSEFVPYGKSLYAIMYEWDYDEIRIVVAGDGDGVTVNGVKAVLKDGDSYEMSLEKARYGEVFFMYAPKPVKSISVADGEGFINLDKTVSLNKEAYKVKLPCDFSVPPKTTGTNVEVSITFKYEDGTDETITVYITKEHIIS